MTSTANKRTFPAVGPGDILLIVLVLCGVAYGATAIVVNLKRARGARSASGIVDAEFTVVSGPLRPGDPHPTRKGWVLTDKVDRRGNPLWYKPPHPAWHWARLAYFYGPFAIGAFLLVVWALSQLSPEVRAWAEGSAASTAESPSTASTECTTTTEPCWLDDPVVSPPASE